MIDEATRSQLAPRGTLRAGINLGNVVLATRDPATRSVSGIAPALARALADEAGMPADLVVYESAGRMAADVGEGAWDVAFLAIDPERERGLAFSEPYLVLEGAYLVSEESGIDVSEDVDQEGVRIGVSERSAYDLHLRRTLRHARRVAAASPEAAFELILDGTVDVVAGVRQQLAANVGRIAAGRVFEEPFMTIEQAIAVPAERSAAAVFVQAFVGRAKVSGAIAAAIAGTSFGDVAVAP